MSESKMVSVPRELLDNALKTIHGLQPGRFSVEQELRDILAQPVADEQAEQRPVRYREADRVRFPDSAFNKWLDESISDSGHTVWDQIGDTADAWSGWENRQYYANPVAQASQAHPDASMLVAVLERIKKDTRLDDPLQHYDAVCDALTAYRAALSAQGGD